MRVWRDITIGGLVLAGALPFHAARAQDMSNSVRGAAVQRPAIRFAVPLFAIAAALAEDGLDVAPDQIHLAVPVSTTTSAPVLQLASAELRQDGSLLLRMTCRRSGDCLPFYASVPMPDRAEALGALAKLRGRDSAPISQQAAGVMVGAHITLQLSDGQMHIQMPAIAIDAGPPGSEIRVASLDRKHTYRAVVADRFTVKGGLQ
jgi:hypothetical protein